MGTLVLALNVFLLGGYTLGCHSLRHLVGGRLTQISRKPVQYRSYVCVSAMNRKHMLFAWLSLIWVGFTDLYVRLCSMGVITDWRNLCFRPSPPPYFCSSRYSLLPTHQPSARSATLQL